MKTEPVANLERAAIELDYGVVRDKGGPGLGVDTGGTRVTAERAAGCLIEPEPGDLVLLTRDSFGRSYVLSVLTRANSNATSLDFTGDVALRITRGRLTASATEGVDLAAGGEMNLFAPALNLAAAEADLNVSRLRFVGSILESSIDKIKLAAKTCDSVFERVSQRVQNSYRRITGLENVKAGNLTFAADKLLSLRGRYSAMTAEKDVRIDGDKILMG
jgi:hypothetical protein